MSSAGPAGSKDSEERSVRNCGCRISSWNLPRTSTRKAPRLSVRNCAIRPSSVVRRTSAEGTSLPRESITRPASTGDASKKIRNEAITLHSDDLCRQNVRDLSKFLDHVVPHRVVDQQKRES